MTFLSDRRSATGAGGRGARQASDSSDGAGAVAVKSMRGFDWGTGAVQAIADAALDDRRDTRVTVELPGATCGDLPASFGEGITTIGLDGDDTLWHNECFFAEVQAELYALLRDHHPAEHVVRILEAKQRANVPLFGYGAKSLSLSMLETAVEMGRESLSLGDVHRLLGRLKELFTRPISLLDGAEEVVRDLAFRYRLVLITKGDLFEQESKIQRCGISSYFHAVHIVSEKTVEAYERILASLSVPPTAFLMVGNSVRSDILPVLQIGARAAHVAYPIIWAHEIAEDPVPNERFLRLRTLRELLELLIGRQQPGTI